MSKHKSVADVIAELHTDQAVPTEAGPVDTTPLVVQVLHERNVSYQSGIAAIVDGINIDRPDDDRHADDWTRGHNAASRDIRRRLLELDAPQRALGRISTSARELNDLSAKSVVMDATHQVFISQGHGIFLPAHDTELVDGEAILALSEEHYGVAYAYVLFDAGVRS
jgi:hypothetical protein